MRRVDVWKLFFEKNNEETVGKMKGLVFVH